LATTRSARPARLQHDDKPARRDYRPTVLAQDVVDLIVALDTDLAAVAGHDSSGAVAWLLAMQYPSAWSSSAHEGGTR